MLVFYRTKDCPGCQGIQSAIEAMNQVYKVILVDKGAIDITGAPPDLEPPVLIDNTEIFQGRGNILMHLEELEEFKTQWYKFQSDVCHCDDDYDVIQ